ncbi:MAG: right-handed parallel beta-helix repeat-containing protein [Spirochaetota bacterium]
MKRMKPFSAVSVSGLFMVSLALALTACPIAPIAEFNSTEGVLQRDTTWSGVVEAGYVIVPEGVTLTIEPGTVVKFRADRGYVDVNKGGLGVEGGTLRAIGTAEEQIFFTSDYEAAGFDYAINGDWFGISLLDTDNSELRYTVVEFAEIGVEQFDSSVPVSYSVIRWNNTEGLYAEQSSPTFAYNTLYQNAYHEIALEQFNVGVEIHDNLFQNGFVGVHAENTECTISNNYFDTYTSHAITAGMSSTLNIERNKFYGMSPDYDKIMIPEDSTGNTSNNSDETDDSNRPVFGYSVPTGYTLGYRPATDSDEYLYVYDEEDATREVTKTLGEGLALSFGWALHYYDGFLWRFSIGDGEHGNGLDFIRINPDLDPDFDPETDPETDAYIKMATDFAVNPRGLTHDGEYFYVNDFSEKKLYRFKPPVDIAEGEAVTDVKGWSYDIPDQSEGGTMGLTFFDETLLLLPSRMQDKLYVIDLKNIDPDKPVVAIDKEIRLSHTVGNDIAWHDGALWSTASGYGLGKFKIEDDQANLVGSIYPVAYDAWAITSNGEEGDTARLWTLQKTCELWDDDKLFEIKVKTLL